MLKMLINSKLIYKCSVFRSFNKSPIYRSIFSSNSNYNPRNLFKDSQKKEITGSDITEYKSIDSVTTDAIETVSEIEANLFENSNNKFEPLKGRVKPLGNKYNNQKDQNTKQTKLTEKISKIYKKEYTSRVIEDNELGLIYTRLDLNHPLMNKILMTVRSKKHRDKNQLILIEGRRLFLEAIECGLNLQTVIFSEKNQIEMIGQENLNTISKSGNIYKVPQHDIKMWSTLSTPPGVMGIFKRPTEDQINTKIEKYNKEIPQLPVVVVCDNIREPNNLGSIIRTAAAIPCSEVVVLRGCCDPWDSKALRGGCGGQFRIRVKDDVKWDEYVTKLLKEKSSFFISESSLNKIEAFGFDDKTTIYSDLNVNADDVYIVIIGGETHGVSPEIYSSLSQKHLSVKCVYIPLANGVESLNATTALSLVLFEIRKKYLQNIILEENDKI